MRAPAVSVVMPARDAARTIAASIDSVLAQDFADLELIVVDDGSIDATADIVAAVADPRVRLLRQDNQGVSIARNRAIAAARAELIAFLDADDQWRPDKLGRQVALLRERPEVGLCYTAQTIIDRNGKVISHYAVKPDYRGRCLPALLRSNGLGLSTVLTRAALLRELGGFEASLRHCEDWDLWIRIAAKTELDYVADELTLYRFHPGSATADLDSLRAAQLTVLARHADRYASRAERTRAAFRTYSDYARRYLLTGEWRKGFADLWRALKARPLSPRTWWLCGKLLLYPLFKRDANIAAQQD